MLQRNAKRCGASTADPAVDRAVLGPPELPVAARAQVDLGAGVAEPGAEMLGGGDQLPDAVGRGADGDDAGHHAPLR
jgi:hypothetical protein